MLARLDQTRNMKERADNAPPNTDGDCKPSQALIDELSALESMLAQQDILAELKDEECRKASEEGE
ncbi:MAG: hypothetical protein CMP07_01955 [Xanthomonadales bacterium]|nr:hypothetical protein [Xanthomonadales bacterium]